MTQYMRALRPGVGARGERAERPGSVILSTESDQRPTGSGRRQVKVVRKESQTALPTPPRAAGRGHVDGSCAGTTARAGVRADQHLAGSGISG